MPCSMAFANPLIAKFVVAFYKPVNTVRDFDNVKFCVFFAGQLATEFFNYFNQIFVVSWN